MPKNTKKKYIFDKVGEVIDHVDAGELLSLGTGDTALVIGKTDYTKAQGKFARPTSPDADDSTRIGISDRIADMSVDTRGPRREASNEGSTGDDGHNYPLVRGCGNYAYNEIVRQDKMRVITLPLDDTVTLGGQQVNQYPKHFNVSPFGGTGSKNASAVFGTGFNDSLGGRLILGHKSLTADFHIGTWLYFSTTPSADQTIISKLDSVSGFTGPESGASGPTGGVSGGSGDVFRLWADSGTNNLFFSFSEDGESGTGLNKTLTVGTVGGSIPTRQWKHVAVSYDCKRKFAEVYVDGSRTASLAITGEGLKPSAYPIYIGANRDGTDPFKGYMKDFILKSGNSGAVSPIAGRTGASLSGATQEQSFLHGETLPHHTLYYMSMDGKLGCRNFAVETESFGKGTVTFWDPDYHRLGIRAIETFGDFETFRNNQGFIHGLSSGALHLTSATNNSGFTQSTITEAISTTKGRIDGEFAVQTESLFRLTGNTLAAGHFVNLFGADGPSGGTGGGGTSGTGIIGTGDTGQTGNAGQEFSMFATTQNFDYVTGIANIILGKSGGASGETNAIADADDKVFHLFDREVLGLYEDLSSFFSHAREVRDTKKSLTNAITDVRKIGTQIDGIKFDVKTAEPPKYNFFTAQSS